ncbi:MAG: phosphoglycerate kinase [Euryarchaeota archaeon]|nr:phosphoglycerate kinase [Euryarchaeota archaeon]
MDLEVWTLRDINFSNSVVLLRVDINSPIDPMTGVILNDYRIRAHVDTISYLSANDAKVVILAHQSRPGKDDFTTLEEHAQILSKYVGHVEYVDEICSSRVIDKIKSMSPGEIMLLENVRMNSEEIALENAPIEKQKRALFVKKLSSVANYYVNDAFAVSHRLQPSVTAFPYIMPSAAGFLMEKELINLLKVLRDTQEPKIAILGGAKIDDSIKIMGRLLSECNYDMIITGGLVSVLFLYASGIPLGKANIDTLAKNSSNLEKMVETAKQILKDYRDKILLPEDVAVNKDGIRYEISVREGKEIEEYIMDIGFNTIFEYKNAIRSAKIILVNGPMGAYEHPLFAFGTYEIFNALAKLNAFKVAGGGHTVSVIEQLKLNRFFDHISTGGGAMINFIAGKELPGVKALKDSKKLFSRIE